MTATPALVIGLLERLSELKIQFMIGGSFASSAWGQPRQTNDLDIAVVLGEEDARHLYEATKHEFLGSEHSMIEALNSREPLASFQLLHIEETFKIDFFILDANEYVLGALSRSRLYEISPGKSFPFTSPEDMVLTKLRWFELGNRVSDRQWNDIVQVLEVQQGQLDYVYMDRWAHRLAYLSY